VASAKKATLVTVPLLTEAAALRRRTAGAEKTAPPAGLAMLTAGDGGITTTTTNPVMLQQLEWTRQEYGKEPALLNISLQVAMVPEPQNWLLSATVLPVTVWKPAPPVQVTVSPTWIVTTTGLNESPTIVTLVVAA
jgi:hypothetical protein